MTPKQWMSTLAEYGPVIEGSGPVQLHHVLGRTYKNNKILIGPWFILPLPWQYHDVHSNDPLNVTHHKHLFTQEFGLQCNLFAEMVETLQDRGYKVPSHDVLDSIAQTRR